MVSNEFIDCNVCHTKINLRCQLGYYDIPFHFQCPQCETSIDGKIIINNGATFHLKNATLVECTNTEYYSVELSAEFPTRKMIYKSSKQIELTPFIRNNSFYKEAPSSVHIFIRDAMNFAIFIPSGWQECKRNYELYWNGKTEFLYKELEKLTVKFPDFGITKVTNDLEALLILRYFFLFKTGISSVSKLDALDNYSRMKKKVFEYDKFENEKLFLKLSTSMADEFDTIEKNGFELIDQFTKVYEQLIPVVALKNADCISFVDKEEYGIMTANFEDLCHFYAKSYEWILENINIPIAMNNIALRGNVESYKNKKHTFEKFIKESKINRINYIDKSEPFSFDSSSLNNKIRNPIQHNNSEINYDTQKIKLVNDYKGKKSEENMYLIEFADLCIENFKSIMHILELNNTLRQVYLISKMLPIKK